MNHRYWLIAQIPDNVAHGVDECLQRCGLSRDSQPIKQQQLRLGANAFPSGFSYSNPAPPSSSSSPSSSISTSISSSKIPSSTSSSDASQPSGTGKVSDAVSGDNVDTSTNNNNDNNKPLLIGLIVAVSVMALGYIALAVTALVRRKRTSGKTGPYVRTGEQFAPGGIYEAEKYEFGRPSGEAFRTPYDHPSGSS